MATRAALTIKINNDLASGTSITAAEHRGVEQSIVDSCKPYNAGYFVLGDIAGTGSLTVYGLLSATASSPYTNMSKIVVVFDTATPMPNVNYYVRTFIKSNAPSANQDAYCPYFANTSTTGFDMYIREATESAQSLTIYIEAIPLD
jgi:hypothetical protein